MTRNPTSCHHRGKDEPARRGGAGGFDRVTMWVARYAWATAARLSERRSEREVKRPMNLTSWSTEVVVLPFSSMITAQPHAMTLVFFFISVPPLQGCGPAGPVPACPSFDDPSMAYATQSEKRMYFMYKITIRHAL